MVRASGVMSLPQARIQPRTHDNGGYGYRPHCPAQTSEVDVRNWGSGGVAQSVERRPFKPCLSLTGAFDAGSTPVASTQFDLSAASPPLSAADRHAAFRVDSVPNDGPSDAGNALGPDIGGTAPMHLKILLVALALVLAGSVVPALATASCEVIDGTGEPMTPEKEERFRQLEAECRERIAAAEARDAEEAQRRAENEAGEKALEAEEAEEKARVRARERARQAKELRERRRERREWAHKPTVTKRIAIEFSKWLMRKTNFTIWWIDCDGGRINRIRWSCKVSIFYKCLRGRIQVKGAGRKNGRPWYSANGGELRQCEV
jgi:hypothetical protein